MKTLYLIRGLPGAGKTTFAKQLSTALAATHWETDMFFEKDGVYHFRPALLAKAHQWCYDNVIEDMEHQQKFIVVSNTFTTDKEMNPYKTLALEYGYAVVFLIVENRHGNISVHGVPETTMQKMQTRFQIKLR